MGKDGNRQLVSKYSKARLQDRIREYPSTANNSFKVPATSKQHKERSSIDFTRGAHSERSSRDRAEFEHPRFLQPVFHHSEERKRQVESNIRPFSFERIHQRTEVQDGDSRIDTCEPSRRRLGNIFRSSRCLFPYPHPPLSPKVSQVRYWGRSIPIRGSADGSQAIRPDIHKGSYPHKGYRPSDWDTLKSVPRRLDYQREIQGGGRETDEIYTVADRSHGFFGQPLQVRDGTNTTNSLFRIQLPIRCGNGSPNPSQVGEDSFLFTTFPESKQSTCETVVTADRTSSKHGEVGLPRYVAHSTSAILPTESMEDEQGQLISTSEHHRGSKRSSSMVGQERQHYEWGPPDRKQRRSGSGLHGCLDKRMGGSSRLEDSRRRMDHGREETSHKCSGADGSFADSSTFCKSDKGPPRFVEHGQQYYSSLYPQTGGSEIDDSLPTHSRIVQVCRREPNQLISETHTGAIECSGGQTVEGWRNTTNRVVVTSEDNSSTMVGMGTTVDRPICNQVQQQASNVCIPDSRRESIRHRCDDVELEESVGLRVSSDSAFEQSLSQVQRRVLRDDPDCSTVEEPGLVCKHSGFSHRQTAETTPNTTNAETTAVHDISSQPGGVQSSCLEIIRGRLEAKGFSIEAATRIATPVKPSTSNVYEGKWKGFSNWCKTRNIDPTKCSLPLIADFLLSLHEKGLTLSTIEGYRTAINKVTCVTQNLDIGKDIHISNLLANLNRTVPKEVNTVPAWNLALVLKAFTEAPFEPLKKISLKLLTLKTVFLLALATGKRRSELHALTYESLTWKEDMTSFTVNTATDFLAKTQKNSDNRDNSVTIEALPRKKEGEDIFLCPVRALRTYVDRTDNFRGEKKLLFISWGENRKDDIKANTLSSWIKQAITQCYDNASDKNLTYHRVKAHDVRAFAASWAHTKHASTEKLMRACSWKSSSTFTKFYLKDMTVIRDDMMSLGPVLAATQLS